MRKKCGKALWAWAALAGAAAWAPHVSGAIVDLTTNQTGTANGALFQRADFRPAGTGFIDSFVRIQTNNPVEQGYNTSGRPLPFNENSSPVFTHDITFGQVPTVTFNGTDYKEFLLDINQDNANPRLSLDQIRIFTSSTGGQTTTNVGSLGTERYSLDAGGDNTVLLDDSITSGSGQGDMFLLVPLSAFGTSSNGDFVYLFSRFGDTTPNNGGFEEWATAIPLPNAAWTGLIGLAAVGVRYGLRRRLPV